MINDRNRCRQQTPKDCASERKGSVGEGGGGWYLIALPDLPKKNHGLSMSLCRPLTPRQHARITLNRQTQQPINPIHQKLKIIRPMQLADIKPVRVPCRRARGGRVFRAEVVGQEDEEGLQGVCDEELFGV